MRPQQADLALAKTVNVLNPNVGDTITYIIALTDNGPNTATECPGDRPPADGPVVRFGGASQGTYDPAPGVWNVGTVTVGAPADPG